MTSRILACALLGVLPLCASAHAAPADDPKPGRGFEAPPGDGQQDPGRARHQLFISPAGEPFRAQDDARYPVAAWFSGADANHDGALSRDEFVADAGRFFAVLDADKDNIIDGFEVSTYEKNIAPEILLGANPAAGPSGSGGGPPRKRGGLVGGGMQGAAPYALLAEPQPVMGADADFNRRISRDEALKAARSRFALLDADQDLVLHLDDLPKTPVQDRGANRSPRRR